MTPTTTARPPAPTVGLVRQVDFVARAEADPAGDGFTLEGYGAVFGTATRIDSWEGTFDEVIAAGAFRKTLAERGARVVLQFDHGQHPLIGSLPIGAIEELTEDARGLYVRARLFDNDLVKPVRDAIAGQAIKGMSFRFEVMAEAWNEDGPVPLRTITEVRLHELGPVVFPAYEQTTVGVRALEVARNLITDPDFRQQVARALLSDGTATPAAAHAAPDDAAAPLDDADAVTAPRVRNRADDWQRIVDRITPHLPQEGSA